MKLFLILVIIKVISSQTIDVEFENWKDSYGIEFSSAQDRQIRKLIFSAKLANIQAHNANPRKTYKKGLNKFSAYTTSDFLKAYCRTQLPKNLKDLASTQSSKINTFKFTLERTNTPTLKIVSNPFGSYTSSDAPNTTDFRNLMLPVQDQGGCGSCWAFATVGQLEGMLKARNALFNTVLAPQFLVDCDTTNGGCDGGWPTGALEWLKSRSGGNNGCPSMSAYPYKERERRCRSRVRRLPLGINTITQHYFENDEDALKVHIANFGPAIVAIYVSDDFPSYSSGVFYDETCPTLAPTCSDVNHAVVVTGYGTDPVYGDYWMVKNSWGAEWGENGYIRMARNRNNNCNLSCWISFAM